MQGSISLTSSGEYCNHRLEGLPWSQERCNYVYFFWCKQKIIYVLLHCSWSQKRIQRGMKAHCVIPTYVVEMSWLNCQVKTNLTIRVSKFSKNLFREIFEAHSKIIYFIYYTELSTQFILHWTQYTVYITLNTVHSSYGTEPSTQFILHWT